MTRLAELRAAECIDLAVSSPSKARSRPSSASNVTRDAWASSPMACVIARLLRWRYACWRCAAVMACVAAARWPDAPLGAVATCGVGVWVVADGVVSLIGCWRLVGGWGFRHALRRLARRARS